MVVVVVLPSRGHLVVAVVAVVATVVGRWFVVGAVALVAGVFLGGRWGPGPPSVDVGASRGARPPDPQSTADP
jgi:hypothetical protein